ncbi:MAG TPA: hypothetical protein VFZ25_01330 [Chloroflexota bacterium]|nr:hypothetical protein [Chloroflexota bacterium]
MRRGLIRRFAIALVTATAAFAAFAGSALAWNVPMHGKPEAYQPFNGGTGAWVWVTHKGVLHVRTTGVEGTTRQDPLSYSGFITTDADLTDLTEVRTEKNDQITQDGHHIAFDLNTRARTDGFNVQLEPGSSVTLYFALDGKPMQVTQINLGKNSNHLDHNPGRNTRSDKKGH